MMIRNPDDRAEGTGFGAGFYQPVPPVDVWGIFHAFWRGKWIILGAMICAVFTAGYYAFTQTTPAYAATATISLDRTAAGNDDTGFTEISPTQLNTQAAILRSRHILENVIVALDLERDQTFNRYLLPVSVWSVAGLRDRARALITAQPATDVTAQELRDKTIDNLAAMLRTGPERGTHILGVTATTANPNQSQMIANAVAQAYLDDQVAAHAHAVEDTITRLGQRVAQLQQDLQTKETAINALLTSGQMTDETALDRLSQQANAAAQRLAEARQSPAQNPQIDALQSLHDRLTAQLSAQSDGLVALQQLRREAQSTRALYTTLLAQLQQTQGVIGSDPAAARILSPAAPGRYVAPRKTYIIAIAALLGAFAGMAYVLVQRQRHVQSTAFFTTGNWRVVARFQANPKRKNLRYNQDAANRLRTAVTLHQADRAQIILATTCEKTATGRLAAWALAQSFARIGRSVLFIDAQTSRTTDMCDSATDIAHFMSHDAVFAQENPASGITCLHVADPKNCAADIIGNADFGRFLERARARFDQIVMHAADVGSCAEAQIFAHHSDAVIVTLNDNQTRQRDWENAQRALRHIATAPEPLIAFTG